jgi:hypothetical protein
MNRRIKIFKDITCGELHCIDPEKPDDDICDYLIPRSKGWPGCSLFDEHLSRSENGNYIRCGACRDAENE